MAGSIASGRFERQPGRHSQAATFPGSNLLQRLRRLALRAKREALFAWLAARDPRTPWLVKLICGAAAAYVFSPVQLLPDFLPVIGYVDDIAVVALAAWLARKLLPSDLSRELHAKAESISNRPVSRAGAAVILLLWVALGILVGVLAWHASKGR